jgi:colanic acid biosynthesis glycosyl transferase WcaI
MPTKLFEYMATGKPLVYAGNGLAVEFLEKIGCALTVASEDPEALTAAIQQLLSDARLRHTLGSRGRDFVRRNYHRDELMEGLARELRTRFG